ncbi:MAG: hypothetical protein E6Q78_07615 [Rhodoferax sp.]|nr:MAG: hypothetical protein E6Q78_07615 [Rhodoferax sp.]
MSNFYISLLLCFALLAPAAAQTKHELAFELAKVISGSQFKSLQPLLDGALENLKYQTRESGKLDRVMEIWIDEMKESTNPESFTQVMAVFWAEQLTLSELQQALEMVRSPIYKKLTGLSVSMAQPRTIAPIVKEACKRTRVRAQAESLSTRDIDIFCQQFAL